MGFLQAMKQAWREGNAPLVGNGEVLAHVVGGQYYATGALKPGYTVVVLRREPQNPHDANAIAVVLNGNQIGHLSRHFAEQYASLLDEAGHPAMRVNATVHTGGNVDVHLPARTHPVWGGAAAGSASARLWTVRPAGRVVEPWGRLTRQLDIDDEHLHRAELAAVMHRHGGDVTSLGSEIRDVEALLIAPRSGEPMEMGVAIAGCRVGRLTDEDELAYRPELVGFTRIGCTLKVTARVWVIEDGVKVRGRVVLNMPDVGQVAPPSSLPSGRIAVLPFGSKVQVAGEEEHLDVLSELLSGRHEAPVAATLHPLTKESARSRRTVVEVRCGGARVGELTQAMSQNFLPLIELCQARGITLVCRAAVRGNAVKADVVLDTAKAGDLPQAWIDQNVMGRSGL